jgi:hypothetical protein
MNVEARMPDGVFIHDGDPGLKFDLEERTARFGEAVVGFAQGLPQNPITWPLINQLVRSGTSVGAKELHLIFAAIYRK